MKINKNNFILQKNIKKFKSKNKIKLNNIRINRVNKLNFFHKILNLINNKILKIRKIRMMQMKIC
jgi:hypothetical protein